MFKLIKNQWILFIYIFLVFCLFLYSFTQVDLNLTLSRSSWFQTVEKSFQYIGYFNRPLSTLLFVTIVVFLFILYTVFLRLAVKNKLKEKQVWIILIISTIILTFAYNAFSYDMFNYIFDAKVFTFYHQNPYIHKALDFPDDKMLHFMRWTQRTYPYGPIWLALTVPISFIGLQIFLPTFFLFKLLAVGSFLGTCYIIQKISKKLFPENALCNLIFFAFNPLVLIESLVSGHIDIVMMFFCMIALWFLVNRKWLWAFLLLLFSAGIKFATGLLLPVFFLYYVIASGAWQPRKWQQKPTGLLRCFAPRNDVVQIFLVSSVVMIAGVVWESYHSGNFQPWYLLIIAPFASLIAKKYYIVIATFCMTFFALLEYVPFLYRGDWNPPVPTILNGLTLAGVVLSVIIATGWKIFRPRNSQG